MVAPSGIQRVDGLLSGFAWSQGTVSFGAPVFPFQYGVGYASDLNGNGVSAQFEGFQTLADVQLRTVVAALNAEDRPAGRGFAVAGFTGLALVRAAEPGAADIRVANSADAGNSAYAYYPGTDPAGLSGDVWFGGLGRSPVAGNFDHLTVLHELGHALGLKHPFEDEGFGRVPVAFDSYEYTLMTYRAYPGQPLSGPSTVGAGSFPQSYMMLDIAALQHLYGANYAVNAGPTVYSWRPGQGTTFVNGVPAIEPGSNKIFVTVWDGGGRDRYDLSAYATPVSIDLRPGMASSFAAGQLAELGGGPNGGLARGNVFNALLHQGDGRSLIEDAVGGQGNDLIRGNAAANRLIGGAGNDRLFGLQGNDELFGGPGNDALYGGPGNDRLNGGPGNDRLNGGPGNDWLNGGPGADRMAGGPGNDTYVVDNPGDRVIEAPGGGIDRVLSSVSFRLPAHVENLTLTGAAAIDGTGNAGANVIQGNAAANVLRGGPGNDRLAGGAGNDLLIGGPGADVLIGGPGRDVYAGGPGADRFVFVAAGHAGVGATRDRILDFQKGIDRLDLRPIDADPLAPGDQAFVFRGAAPFGGAAGELRSVPGLVAGDVTGNGLADFEIALANGAMLAAGDILL